MFIKNPQCVKHTTSPSLKSFTQWSQPQIHPMHITDTSAWREINQGLALGNKGAPNLSSAGDGPWFTPRSSHTLAWVPLTPAPCLTYIYQTTRCSGMQATGQRWWTSLPEKINLELSTPGRRADWKSTRTKIQKRYINWNSYLSISHSCYFQVTVANTYWNSPQPI